MISVPGMVEFVKERKGVGGEPLIQVYDLLHKNKRKSNKSPDFMVEHTGGATPIVKRVYSQAAGKEIRTLMDRVRTYKKVPKETIKFLEACVVSQELYSRYRNPNLKACRYALMFPADKHAIGIPTIYEGQIVSRVTTEAFTNENIKAVKMHNQIVEIQRAAFSYNNIDEVDLPVNIGVIMNKAFYHNNIIELDIPKSLEFLASEAFGKNPLTKVTIREPEIESNPFTYNKGIKFTSIGSRYSTGPNNDCLIDNKEKKLITGNKFGDIPAGIEVLGYKCFAGLDQPMLRVPETIKYIEGKVIAGSKVKRVHLGRPDIECHKNSFKGTRREIIVLSGEG